MTDSTVQNDYRPIKTLVVNEGFVVPRWYPDVHCNVHRRASKLGIKVKTWRTEEGELAIYRVE